MLNCWMVTDMRTIKWCIDEVDAACPISRQPTEIAIELIDKHGEVVEDGWYMMRGSRFYKPTAKHWGDRVRQGEYWYSVADKAGARFARAFCYRGCKHFFVSAKFFDRMAKDVCLYTGKAKDSLRSSFESGFYAELRRINPILGSAQIQTALDLKLKIPASNAVRFGVLVYLSVQGENQREIFELESLLHQTNYLIDNMRNGTAYVA